MLERVLVAIDDSAPSRHALDIAVEFCIESNAKAHVVHIRELALAGAYRADWNDEPNDAAARLVDNASLSFVHRAVRSSARFAPHCTPTLLAASSKRQRAATRG